MHILACKSKNSRPRYEASDVATPTYIVDGGELESTCDVVSLVLLVLTELQLVASEHPCLSSGTRPILDTHLLHG